MMSVLKNRKVAVIVTVLISVAAVLFGVNRSLRVAAADVEDMFYRGVYIAKEGYTQPSIDSQLRKRSDSALGVAMIASNYAELEKETQTLLNANRRLNDAERILDKSLANDELQIAYNVLIDKLYAQDLSGRDLEAVSKYTETFFGAQGIIENSRYNSEVLKYVNETSNTFPVSVLKWFVFVRNPEVF